MENAVVSLNPKSQFPKFSEITRCFITLKKLNSRLFPSCLDL